MSRYVDNFVKIMAIASGVVLCCLVVLTFYDVIARYFFSAPLRGRQDIVEMGMVLTLMLAAPFAWREGGHISVDLYEALPNPVFEVFRVLLVKLLVAAVFALIAWRGVEAIEDAALFNEATNMIMIPHQPLLWVIMVVSILHALILLFEGWVDLRRALGRNTMEGSQE